MEVVRNQAKLAFTSKLLLHFLRVRGALTNQCLCFRELRKVVRGELEDPLRSTRTDIQYCQMISKARSRTINNLPKVTLKCLLHRKLKERLGLIHRMI